MSIRLKESHLYVSVIQLLALVFSSFFVLYSDFRRSLLQISLLVVFFISVVIRPLIWEAYLTDKIWLGNFSVDDFIKAQTLGHHAFWATLVALFMYRYLVNQPAYFLNYRKFVLSIDRKKTVNVVNILLCSLSIFMIVVHVAIIHLGIGFHGAGNSTLPYRIGGILTELRSWVFYTGLVLYSMCVSTRLKSKSLMVIALLLMDTLVTTYATGSRGVIFGNSMLFFITSLFLKDRIDGRKTVLYTLFLSVVFILLYPYLNLFRQLGGSLQRLIEYVQEESMLAFDYTVTIYKVLTRISGTEQAAPFFEFEIPHLSLSKTIALIAERKSVATWFNEEVLRIPVEMNHGEATGFLGEIYAFTGVVGIFPLTLIIILFFSYFWDAIRTKSFFVLPVVLAFIVQIVLNWFSEGGIVFSLLSEKGLIAKVFFFFLLERSIRTIIQFKFSYVDKERYQRS